MRICACKQAFKWTSVHACIHTYLQSILNMILCKDTSVSVHACSFMHMTQLTCQVIWSCICTYVIYIRLIFTTRDHQLLVFFPHLFYPTSLHAYDTCQLLPQYEKCIKIECFLALVECITYCVINFYLCAALFLFSSLSLYITHAPMCFILCSW